MDIKILECAQFFKVALWGVSFHCGSFQTQDILDSMNLGNWDRRENVCQENIKEELLLLNDSIYLNSETNSMLYGLNFSLCVFENFKHMYVQKKCICQMLKCTN